jgi:hypothetical protein
MNVRLCKTEPELVELIQRCAELKFNGRCPAFNKNDIKKMFAKDELTTGANVEYLLLRYYEETCAFGVLGSDNLRTISVDEDIIRLTLENRYFRKHGVYFFTKHGKDN